MERAPPCEYAYERTRAFRRVALEIYNSRGGREQRRGESRHLSGRFYPYHRHRVETMGDARALERRLSCVAARRDRSRLTRNARERVELSVTPARCFASNLLYISRSLAFDWWSSPVCARCARPASLPTVSGSILVVAVVVDDAAVATVVVRRKGPSAAPYRRYWRRLVRGDACSKQTPVGEPGSIISIALSARDEALSRCSPTAIASMRRFEPLYRGP